jgi:hypothetical protein
MKPKYSASVTKFSKRMIDIYFPEDISLELAKSICNLESHKGLKVETRTNNLGGFYITLTPVWDVDEVIEEIVLILVSEGFERSSIFVK